MSKHNAPVSIEDFDSSAPCDHSSPASEQFSLVGDEDETWAVPAPTLAQADNTSSDGWTRHWNGSDSGRDDDWCEERNRDWDEEPDDERASGGVEELRRKVDELRAQLDLAKREKEQDAGTAQQTLLYYQRERDCHQSQLEQAREELQAAAQWRELALQQQERLGGTENGLRMATTQLASARCGLAVWEAARQHWAADLAAQRGAAQVGWAELEATRTQLQSARMNVVHAQDAANRATEETRRLAGELQTAQQSLQQAQKALKEREEELEYIRSW